MIYPHSATVYTYGLDANKKATYTKGSSFRCQAEQSPSKLKTATGAVTSADTMVYCALKGGVLTKKQDRLLVDKGNGIVDVVEIVKSEPAGRLGCEIYATLKPTVKVDANGVMS